VLLVLRHLVSLVAAGAVALAAFVAFAWFGLPFATLAAIALLAFLAVLIPLLKRSAVRAGLSGSAVWKQVLTWSAGATIAYVVAAHTLVGRTPRAKLAPPEPAPGTRFWALANGSRLAYVVAEAKGPKKGRAVILHDGPGVPALPLLQKLPQRPYDFLTEEGFDVYYYDQLGSGLSSRLDLEREPPYTVRRHVQDLEEIRRTLGVQRLSLIGEGWGASLAVQYLVNHPDRVERLILLSPAPLWYRAWPQYLDPAARARISDVQATALALLQRPTLRLVVGRMMEGFNPRVAHAIVKDWEADEWWTHAQEEALRLGQPQLTCSRDFPQGLFPLSGLGFFAHSYTMRDAERLPDPRPLLANITVPVLVVRGSCDYVDWRVSYEYLAALPGARYVAIPAAGHLVWFDQPRILEEVIAAFVRGEPLPLEFYDPSRVPQGTPRLLLQRK
jgi:proline iminopeptidase